MNIGIGRGKILSSLFSKETQKKIKEDVNEIANKIAENVQSEQQTSQTITKTLDVLASLNAVFVSRNKTNTNSTDNNTNSNNDSVNNNYNDNKNVEDKNTETPSVTISSDSAAEVAEKLKINGKIDETVYQSGFSGDCGLVSTILALNSSQAGKNAIKKAITVNGPSKEYPNGSVTVNFSGINQSYTISTEDIIAHDTDKNTKDAYSNGDNDALILEMAMERLRLDIKSGEVTVPQKHSRVKISGKDNLHGVTQDDFLYFLTGKEKSGNAITLSSKGLSYKKIEQTLTEAAQKQSVTTFILLGDKTDTIVGVNVPAGHAFAITNIDTINKKVTFVNPWISSKEYTISWEEFANIGVSQLQYAYL